MDSLQNSDDLNHERVAKLAYKYSQQKRFASCSTEENWRQAEKQLGYSRHDHIPFIQGLADRLQSLSELTARFLTILGGLYIIAVALGAVLLIAYLREIGAPTPPIDTAMTVFLLFLAIVFVSLFSVFVLVLLIPFIAKHIDSSLADVYPSLFYTRPLTNGDGQDYWRDYLKFFLPFFSSLIGMAAVIPLYLGHYADWISSTVIWGAFITGTVIEFHYLRRLQKYKNLKLFGALRAVANYLWVSVIASLMSVLWIMSAVVVMASKLERNYPHSNGCAWFLLFISVLIIVIIHFFLNAFFTNLKQTVMVIMVFAIGGVLFGMVYWPQPSYLGGESLRFLRLGGGIPIAIFLKSAQQDKSKPEPVTGCLILVTGSEVLVSPKPFGQECSLHPSSAWSTLNQRRPLMHVDVYERSDVLRTSIARTPDLNQKRPGTALQGTPSN